MLNLDEVDWSYFPDNWKDRPVTTPVPGTEWLYDLPALRVSCADTFPPREVVDVACRAGLTPGDDLTADAPIADGDSLNRRGMRWWSFSVLSSTGYGFSVAKESGSNVFWITVDGCDPDDSEDVLSVRVGEDGYLTG